jgi:hypothetical protein
MDQTPNEGGILRVKDWKKFSKAGFKGFCVTRQASRARRLGSYQIRFLSDDQIKFPHPHLGLARLHRVGSAATPEDGRPACHVFKFQINTGSYKGL